MTRLILELDCAAEHDELDTMARAMARSIERDLGYPVRGVHIEDDAVPQETVLEEAQRIVYGARQEAYGHPFDDFGRTSQLMTALVQHKLKYGQSITRQDVALFMICVKLSREVNQHKRDNAVDGAGYWATLQMIYEEAEKRGEQI